MDHPGPIVPPPGTTAPAIRPRDRLTIPVLASGGILMAVMQTVVVPLLPDLPRLTGASAATVSWMVTATLLAGAVLTPVLGRAGDMYGKRRVLTGALALMTVGSVMCALSSDIGVLIAARALQPALEAALFRHSEVAGDTFHLRIVEAVGRKLVVRRQQLEHR